MSVRRPPLAYVGGWLGKSNLGDQALLQAARLLFPDYSLWHFDGSRTLATLLQAWPRTTCGLFAGGTLINRAPELLELAQRFRRRGRDLFFVGAGVADPDFWNGRGDFRDMLPQWRTLLDACGRIGVRGPRSAELLADAGVTDVEVIGDPVLTFAGDAPAVEVPEPWLGLNIGFDHGHQWGNPRRLHGEMLALAQRALAAGWRVKWFVVFPQDVAITRAIADATGTADRIFCCYEDHRRFIAEVRAMRLFVGMKLHATMLALCAYVPSLMLEYEPKCADFMRSIRQDDALVRTDRFAAGAAWDVLSSWHGDRIERAASIREAVLDLRRRQRRFAQSVAAQIAARS